MRKTKGSFTLVEMLIVIVIIGILAAALIPRLQSVQGRARDTRRKADMRNYSNAAYIKYTDVGSHRTSLGWLYQDYTFLSGYLTSPMTDDPSGTGGNQGYQYRRKDYDFVTFFSHTGNQNDASKFAFYSQLENPTSIDLSSMIDIVDGFVRGSRGHDYRMGN